MSVSLVAALQDYVPRRQQTLDLYRKNCQNVLCSAAISRVVRTYICSANIVERQF